MKSLSVLIWLLLAQMALGQMVVVKAGDHPGFTRLVLELPKVTDWRLGRTADGYDLRIAGDRLRFDVTGVFTDIGRSRLAAIWVDPATNDLRLGIACACHAMPFEFRPGIIVIDLREGPPPKGSSFELALDGTNAEQLAARPTRRPRSRPQPVTVTNAPAMTTGPAYDWLQPGSLERDQKPLNSISLLGTVTAQYHDIAPLKQALLHQLSRGAAQGIVQMTAPSLASRKSGDPLPTGPRANIHIGEAPGFAATTQRAPDDTLIDGGADCLPDDALDLTSWGDDQPVPLQLAKARGSLLGEFDRPDPDAVIATTKLFIHLGFGAEALQLMAQMPVDDPQTEVRISLAKLVDGGTDATGPFAGMQTCETAAALWATLALPKVSLADKPRLEAVLRAFSALPAHMRRNLGPTLAERFLALGDTATARSISAATQRGMTTTEPAIAVMDATINLAAGDPTKAAAQLAPIVVDAGPVTGDALIALVDARIAAGKAVDPETPVALAALVREQSGSDLEPALRRAQILALGSSGDFDQAFALLPQMAGATGDLWALLANSGQATAILNHAVVGSDTDLPALPAKDRSKIAAHLRDLGLSDAALEWIGPQTDATSADDRLIAAKANLSNGQPDASLAWIAGMEDAAAIELRARALSQLGKPGDAAKAWAEIGNDEAALRALGWARNWEDLSKSDASAWQAAAGLLDAVANPVGADAPGPLARGAALVADSAAARATLTDLLANVLGPPVGK